LPQHGPESQPQEQQHFGSSQQQASVMGSVVIVTSG
jgi:hypothetical protein